MALEAACEPIVSIVVPVYNVEPYLEACMDQLVGQTLREIEIICVDDASTDGSLAILERYDAADDRVKLIRHTECLTAAAGRKEGVLASRGEYIVFVDPDDLLDPDACQLIVEDMRREPVDILQYGSTVIATSDVTQERINAVLKLLEPYPQALQDTDLLEAVFLEKKFGFNLWNKAFNAEKARQGMRDFPDGYFPKGQDLLAFFIMGVHMHSYRMLDCKPLYTYRLGSGVTGGARLSERQINAFAMQSRVPDAIDAYLSRMGLTERYSACAARIRENMLREVVTRLMTSVSADQFQGAWDKYCECWGVSPVISAVTLRFQHHEDEAIAKLSKLKQVQYQPRNIRTVAAFYHMLANGGAQRVAVMLCNIWAEMGYRVIVFTDDEPTDNDYPLSSAVQRVVLGKMEFTCAALQTRAELIRKACEEYQIDAVIYHAWVSPSLPWDMLAFKLAGTAFLIHTHSVFGMRMTSRYLRHVYMTAPVSYRMADGVITLTDVDETYWKIYNDRVFQTRNPIFFDLQNIQPSNLQEKQVLFVGRLSAEKQPMQAVNVMAEVVKEVPDARLVIVGSGTEDYEALLTAHVQKLGLTEHVTMAGFQQDVMPFYGEAAVFLCTSQYEGFSLTILEAEAHGVPVVSYSMPYLPILATGQGCIQVEQNNVSAAANAIIQLLSNDEERRIMGSAARRNVEQHMSIDQAQKWASIFGSLTEDATHEGSESDTQLLIETLHSFMAQAQIGGMVSFHEYDKTRQQLRELQKEKSERWAELQQLRQEKGERWAELQQLKREKGERWAELQKVRRDALKKETAYRSEIKALKEELSNLRQERSNRWVELQQLRQEKSERWAELQQLRQEKSERWTELQQLRQEKGARQTKLQTVHQQNTASVQATSNTPTSFARRAVRKVRSLLGRARARLSKLIKK